MPRLLLTLAAVVLAATVAYLLWDDPDPAGDAGLRLDEESLREPTLKRPPGLEAGPYRPGARKAQAADVAVAPEAQGPFTFVVTDAASESPLSGVHIESDDGIDRFGTTGGDGRLSFDSDGVSSIVFRTQLDGFLPHRGYARAGVRQDLALTAGIPIGGRVILDATGEGAKGASVRVFDEDLEREIASLTTDEDGRFEIPAVRPNYPFLLITTVEGFVPQRQSENFDSSVKDLEVRVGGGSVLRGRVLDPKDHTLPNMEVRLLRPGEPLLENQRPDSRWNRGAPGLAQAQVGVTRTDDDGVYVFAGIAQKRHVQAVVRIDKRFEARSRPVHFRKPGGTREEDILTPKPAALRIHVEDDLGRPIGNADVSVGFRYGRWRIEKGDRRPDGSLLLDPVTPGVCTVSARLAGAPAVPPEKVALRPATEAEVTITLPRGQAITGQILNKKGEGIARAKVRWTAEGEPEDVSILADLGGHFALTRLQGKVGTVSIDARDVPYAPLGYEPQQVEGVKPGAVALRIVLEAGTRVRGHFPDLPEETEVYCSMLPGPPADSGYLWLDDERRFTRRGPRAGGSAQFIFWTKGFPPLRQPGGPPFGPQEDRDLGALTFRASNPLKGQVRDERGRPLRAVKVTILTSWLRRSLRTDRDGHFEFSRLPEQDIPLRLEAEGLPPNRVVLKPSSQFQRQVFRLTRKGTLHLTLQGSKYASRRGYRVRIVQPKDEDTGVRPAALEKKVNSRGVLKLELLAGTYEVTATDSTRYREGAGKSVEVTAGRTQNLKLKLSRKWLRNQNAERLRRAREAQKRQREKDAAGKKGK